jgi:hypothetical protein
MSLSSEPASFAIIPLPTISVIPTHGGKEAVITTPPPRSEDFIQQVLAIQVVTFEEEVAMAEQDRKVTVGESFV